jgi:hypothetical protein
MNIKETLKSLLSGSDLKNDGSKELASEYLALVENQEDLNTLLQNKAFLKMLDYLERDFVSRMQAIVQSDSELSAIKRMFIRTVGLKDAEAIIEKKMKQFLEEDGL